MSKESLLKWLPYVLFYILIFRDPYSAIIPVSEPALTYSPETTWLLDGTTNETDFAAAYNRHFKDLLHDERNAFPYFLKAVQNDGYTPEGKAILGSFTAKGENVKGIPALKSNSPLLELVGNLTDGIRDIARMPKDEAQAAMFEIMDLTNLPVETGRYEEPLFSARADQVKFSVRMSRYVINLSQYGMMKERVGKALFHLRLLSNTADAGRMLLCVRIYRYLVNDGPLSKDEIKKIEKNLPPWPNTKALVTRLHRARVTLFTTCDNQLLSTLVRTTRKDDSDFFVDRNELLLTADRYYTAMEKALPDRPLDEACGIQSEIITISAAYAKGPGRRPLAERMLFSGSIGEKHRRFAKILAAQICSLQSRLLCEAMDNLEHVYEPIPKDTKPNGP